jgi:hypothetical protein
MSHFCGMEEKKPRKPQIGVEVTAEEKSLIERVAKARGMRAATLLRTLALEEARRLKISSGKSA